MKEATDNNKRYVTLKHHPGIRKDLKTNSYYVTKSIKGKRYFTTMTTLTEAIHWKNTFHPDLTETPRGLVPLVEVKEPIVLERKLNGENEAHTLRDVWKLYQKYHFPQIEYSSREMKLYRFEFFTELLDIKMVHFSPEIMDRHIENRKEMAILKDSKRCNFDAPLRELRALFNWYRENYDFRFINPILKRHKFLGMIRKPPVRNKKMEPEEVSTFFENLIPFYRDYALVQFYIAGRVQEVAGIQVSSVDLKNRTLLVKDVVVWDKKKRFQELKPHTKNGGVRYCHLNDILYEIFERKLKEVPKGCSYVFHEDGQPLLYRKIQHQYNMALKRSGIDHKYSSTHIMRHSMATITRRVTGSLDATQAVTGHKDQRLVQHYASLPCNAQIEAVKSVELFMREVSESVRADACKKEEGA